jgi:hypothetical protein
MKAPEARASDFGARDNAPPQSQQNTMDAQYRARTTLPHFSARHLFAALAIGVSIEELDQSLQLLCAWRFHAHR